MNFKGFLDRFADLTDDQWRRRDRAVAEAREREADQERLAARTQRIHRLLESGAPPRVVRGAFGPHFDQLCAGWQSLQTLRHDRERPIRVLAGGVGVGKTWAAVRWLGEYGGDRPAFTRTASFGAASAYGDASAELQRSSALVIDDMGAEYLDAKGNLMARLDELVDVIVGRGTPAIITTNLTVAEFRKRYSERIVSRVRGHGRFLAVAGDDRRTAA